ncbi:hypothetical protein DTL70_01055 [Streptomyces diacarni]|uniref:Uncharacterized protein n=2 Tax=Streptomyces diacarni TaxID=2800381 RepID=A0A367FHJ6_9ACTN|nr:hypothetical protein DTL70_01055 [Streptomyces diacarni]
MPRPTGRHLRAMSNGTARHQVNHSQAERSRQAREHSRPWLTHRSRSRSAAERMALRRSPRGQMPCTN